MGQAFSHAIDIQAPVTDPRSHDLVTYHWWTSLVHQSTLEWNCFIGLFLLAYLG